MEATIPCNHSVQALVCEARTRLPARCDAVIIARYGTPCPISPPSATFVALEHRLESCGLTCYVEAKRAPG